MFKHEQAESTKSSKKPKEIKLLNNYIPVKKTNAYSNISEYETEISIQKNFSNKCQQSKNNMQAKSVQTTHNNQTSVNKYTNTNNNEKEKPNQSQNKPARGSLYNLNNLNLGDYFSEKIIMTQQKFIDYKDNKINTLQKELQLLKKELILYEIKSSGNNTNIKNKKINGNCAKRNKSYSTDKNLNINKNLKDTMPKFHLSNLNTNKILLGNNKSYISFNTFFTPDIMNNKPEITDKKLKKHLSSLLTEANVTNINIKTKIVNNISNNIKHKYKNKKSKKNAEKEINKKNLLNMIYLSKKGCYNHVNNNYDHTTKNVSINLDNNFENNNKENLEEKDIKHDLHFYANNMKERKMVIKENLQSKKENKKDIRMRNDLQNLSDKINNVFNSFFDYYEKNKSNLK